MYALQALPGIGDKLHDKLARAGLVEARTRAPAATLGDLLGRFVATAGGKTSTAAARRQAVNSLGQHFGEGRELERITPTDGDAWRAALVDEGLAQATVAKRVVVAKTIFRRAVKWGMIPANPLHELRGGLQANPARAHYISRETIAAVPAACPDRCWCGVFALARYAGLRVPGGYSRIISSPRSRSQ
jgi:integrase